MIPFFVNLLGVILVLCLRIRFSFLWVGVLILRLGTSEFSAICFYDWFSIDIFSYYLLESLIVIIALPETLCVSPEICYLSSVWNNAYEWLCRKLFLVSQIGSFVNNFELGGSLLAFYDCCYVFHYEVGFYFIPRIIWISKCEICDFLLSFLLIFRCNRLDCNRWRHLLWFLVISVLNHEDVILDSIAFVCLLLGLLDIDSSIYK